MNNMGQMRKYDYLTDVLPSRQTVWRARSEVIAKNILPMMEVHDLGFELHPQKMMALAVNSFGLWNDALVRRYWDDQLKMDRVVTHKTFEHVVNNTWAALEQEDHEVTISTKDLCKVYGLVLGSVLRLMVGYHERSLVAEFGPNPFLTIFSCRRP